MSRLPSGTSKPRPITLLQGSLTRKLLGVAVLAPPAATTCALRVLDANALGQGRPRYSRANGQSNSVHQQVRQKWLET